MTQARVLQIRFTPLFYDFNASRCSNSFQANFAKRQILKLYNTYIVCTVYSTAARAHNHRQSWEIMGPLLLFSSDSGNNGRPLQRGQLVSQTFHTSHALTLNPCTFPLNHFTLLTPAHFPSSVYPICPPFPFSSVICKHFPLSPCPFSPFTFLLIPCHSARFLT